MLLVDTIQRSDCDIWTDEHTYASAIDRAIRASAYIASNASSSSSLLQAVNPSSEGSATWILLLHSARFPVSSTVSYKSSMLGDFTFWLRLSLSQLAERKYGLSTYLAKKWSDFAEPFAKPKLRCKYRLSHSQVRKYGLSTYLDRSLVEIWSKYRLWRSALVLAQRIGSAKV